MVCGTSSGAGKSFVVAALCRLLARRGVRVAPFKGQNMSNNAAVTADGAEIGRAQYAQAQAAGIEPEAVMNPVLLKPTGECTSQVVVMGQVAGSTDARGWGERAPELLPVVLGALADLRRRFEVVVLEGAGSPSEINLFDRDIVNLRLADAAGVPAVVVGDIERGGVFASLYGTVALLPDQLRRRVGGFVINRFRGDPTLLGPGTDELQRRTGVPVLGVLPWLTGAPLDEEDSLEVGRDWPALTGDGLDVAVVAFPHLANASDLDPLVAEPSVGVRLVDHSNRLGRPDLVVLPGSKHTVADLQWLRRSGLAGAVRASGAHVVGICGGYQVLGHTIDDDVESAAGRVAGLGWLDVDTTFADDKVVRRRRGHAGGDEVSGYELHHGRTVRRGGAIAWLVLEDRSGQEEEGAVSACGRVRGTNLHGLFEADGFRRRFLAGLAAARGRSFAAGAAGFSSIRAHRQDCAADLLERHLDVGAVLALASTAAPAPGPRR
jgi:adenosylcobyric acid synthase